MGEWEIVELFGGDEQLVAIWKSFILHNRWMQKPDGKWEISDKGRELIGKFDL